VHETQQPLRGTSGKQADRGQIAPQLAEQIELAVREIGRQYLVQFGFKVHSYIPGSNIPFQRFLT